MSTSLGIPVSSADHNSTLPPKGLTTIHQRALLCFWLSVLFLWVGRKSIKLLRMASVIQDENVPKIAVVENGHIKRNGANDLKNDIQNPEKLKDSNTETSTTVPSTSQPAEFEIFLRCIAVLGTIMLYYYVCDYEHRFTAGARVYSRDVFVFLCLALFLVAVFFTTRETKDTILNRDQTEEWKGMMQVMFVWYHYFKAAETYNAIRVFIAAYVWMTGFGNFSFFWVREDFSLYRLMKMLFRLNFLVLVTCLVTANQYMLYYICAMHTFWFLSVYAMMRPLYKRNTDSRVMATKFLIYILVVFFLFDVPGTGEVAFKPLGFVLTFRGSLHEWMFRAGLDHYATILGMICAYFFPNFEKFLNYLERDTTDSRTRMFNMFIKLVIACGFVVIVGFWWSHVFILEKYDYNKLHPYLSFIPILSYIYLRNMVPFLRCRYIHMFSWLGKITLETYISQLHIYLQMNAKMLIFYIPNYPLLNFGLATLIYISASYLLFHVTVDLSGYLITKDFRAMTKKAVIGCGWFGGCYLMAASYSSFKV